MEEPKQRNTRQRFQQRGTHFSWTTFKIIGSAKNCRGYSFPVSHSILALRALACQQKSQEGNRRKKGRVYKQNHHRLQEIRMTWLITYTNFGRLQHPKSGLVLCVTHQSLKINTRASLQTSSYHSRKPQVSPDIQSLYFRRVSRVCAYL